MTFSPTTSELMYQGFLENDELTWYEFTSDLKGNVRLTWKTKRIEKKVLRKKKKEKKVKKEQQSLLQWVK